MRDNTNRVAAARELRRAGSGRGILHLDERGVIDYADPRAVDIVGRRFEDIVGRSPRALALGADAHPNSAGPSGIGEWDLHVEGDDGARRWLRIVGLPAVDARGVARGAVCAISDITDRRAREIEARELHELYDDAPCGYHSLDASGAVIQINSTELTWLGFLRHEVVGVMPFASLLTEASAERFRRNFDLLKARGTMRDYEYEMLRKDGSSFPVLLSATAVTGPDGGVVRTRASVFDITKEKWAAEEVRRYAESLHAASRRLVELQEVERRSLANALHDLVGQKLTALSINLSIMKAQASDVGVSAVDARLADSLRLVEETVESIRDVMAELRPAVLDDYGLTPVLHWYADTFSRRTGVATEVIADGPQRRLPPLVEQAFFRIAQEALANVAKYARARCVRITMHAVGDEASLTIADEGCGFVVGDGVRPSHDHGWGLTLMRERAAAVGAEVGVESKPGDGTTITVRWKGNRR